MDLFTIRRRSNWADAAELEATAAKSSAEGEKMSDEVRWIRSYVVEEEDGKLGTVCIYEAVSPEAIRRHAEQHRHVGRRDHQGRRHRHRPRGPGRRLSAAVHGRRRPCRGPRAAPRSGLIYTRDRWPPAA